MQLDMTFRGLTSSESATARRALEKGIMRFTRLLDQPCLVRAVFEGGPQTTVTLSLSLRRGDINAQGCQRDIHAAVSEACDKVKAQLVRYRHRNEAVRHKVPRTQQIASETTLS